MRRLISLTQEASDWLDERAAKRGDRGGMSYLARNVERWASEVTDQTNEIDKGEK